jgi:trehalose 6-phosphate phosphatase
MHDGLPTSADGWAFFLDIDGTLVDIAPTPDGVVVPPDLPGLLDRLLARTSGAVALLTGRGLDTIDRLFAPTRLPAGAIHGSQIRYPDGAVVVAPPAPALAGIRQRLAAFVAGHPGALLEDKGTAVAVHYRSVPALHDAVEAEVREAAAAGGEDLIVQPGKMVFEIRPAHADKGHALATLMANPPFEGRRPLAIGDDVTDETMFAAARRLGGDALRVGTAGKGSIARNAFATPTDVRRWLTSMI